MSADGKTFQNYPWSTPVRGYRPLAGRNAMACAEAVWHAPSGDFTYGRFNLTEIDYNLQSLK